MSDLTQLERKLHGYQVILWLKQAFEAVTDDNAEDQNEADEQRPAGDVQEAPSPYGAKAGPGTSPEACCVSKSSVYRAYVDMCHREGRPTLFTRAVVGKMVKRTFPDVRTKRRGPRGRVTQHYIGLRPIFAGSCTKNSPTQLTDRPCNTSDVDSNCSIVAREPTPDSAAEPCARSSVSLLDSTLRYIDAAAKHFDEGIGADHQEKVAGDDQAPGLSGSGEWHSATVFTPCVPQDAAVQSASASWSSHSHSSSPPSTSSSVDSTSSTTIWAPFLPSTLAAMGGQAPSLRPPAPAQHIPLEKLESVWDWRHEKAPSDFEGAWHPTVIDITATAEPTSTRPPLPAKRVDERGGCLEAAEDDLESLLAWADLVC